MLTAITGINWGDEGKGRMVDLLCRCLLYTSYKKLEKSQRERIRMKTERAGKKTQE